MRRLLWMMLLFGLYVWVMGSGHEQMILQYAKSICKSAIAWFDDAEVNFQVQKPKVKKRSRRWD